MPGLWYNAMVANNSSALGVTASAARPGVRHRRLGVVDADDQGVRPAAAPTATGSGTRRWRRGSASPRREAPSSASRTHPARPDNTSLRLADSVNVFDAGALAPGVTVDDGDYRILVVRRRHEVQGHLPADRVLQPLARRLRRGRSAAGQRDPRQGFYVQGAFYPVPKKLELYGATSQIFGDKDAGFGNSSEYLVGMNFYPFDTRNHRLNVQIMDVNRSPVSSSFGYYVGGQDGHDRLRPAFSVFF